jgi:hypothetical protein
LNADTDSKQAFYPFPHGPCLWPPFSILLCPPRIRQRNGKSRKAESAKGEAYLKMLESKSIVETLNTVAQDQGLVGYMLRSFHVRTFNMSTGQTRHGFIGALFYEAGVVCVPKNRNQVGSLAQLDSQPTRKTSGRMHSQKDTRIDSCP